MIFTMAITTTHIILIPKLFTHLWKKQLLKCCDIMIDVSAGKSYWSHDQYVPLTLGICFPFLPFRPWQLRHTPKLFAIERKLPRMLKDNHLDGEGVFCSNYSWRYRIGSPCKKAWSGACYTSGKDLVFPSDQPTRQNCVSDKRRKQA